MMDKRLFWDLTTGKSVYGPYRRRNRFWRFFDRFFRL